MDGNRPIKNAERIHGYFRAGIFLKGALSAIEILGGIVVLIVPVSYFANIILRYTDAELAEEPGNFLAAYLAQFANQFAIAGSLFVAFYLLSRGLIKLGLVTALFKNKPWAYPGSLAVLGLFTLYQLYQIATAPSAFIIGLTVFDFVVLWLIWREYRAALRPVV